MKLFVSRNGQTFGPYSLGQAKDFLAANQLLSTDYALIEGTNEWKPLKEVIENTETPKISQDPPDNQVQNKENLLDPEIKVDSSKMEEPEGEISKQKKPAKPAAKVAKIKKGKGGQIIVVAQEKSFLSKIISTIFVLIFLFLLAIGAIVGAYFAMPSKMGPIFARFGIELDGNSNISSSTEVVDEETKNPGEIMLSEDAWNTLRSSGIKILPIVGKKGVQVISSVDPELAMKDEDLEKLLIIAPHIISLDLTDSKITNIGIDSICKMSNLNKLLLEGVEGINADSLSKLKSLPKLEHLNLIRVKLEAAAIDSLISLESLREVYLFDSGLAEEEITKLKSARPKVFVNSG